MKNSMTTYEKNIKGIEWHCERVVFENPLYVCLLVREVWTNHKQHTNNTQMRVKKPDIQGNAT